MGRQLDNNSASWRTFPQASRPLSDALDGRPAHPVFFHESPKGDAFRASPQVDRLILGLRAAGLP